jgi:hypothetical protein
MASSRMASVSRIFCCQVRAHDMKKRWPPVKPSITGASSPCSDI